MKTTTDGAEASAPARALAIDTDFLWETLLGLLEIPSPAGYTDEVVRHTVGLLEAMGLKSELTRRGAIRCTVPGRRKSPGRAVVAHLDTLGAMVTRLQDNGRVAIAPIGSWSPRFAEGARVTLLCDAASFRGTILPLKASGHVYDAEIDRQPVAWDNLEVRIDARCASRAELVALGVNVGDFIAVDPRPELTDTGFMNSRHLDNKAGVASLLAAARAVVESGVELPLEGHLLFTISEEVGSGASSVLHGDVAEMVSIDNATPAPGQNSIEYGVTVACMDSTGPFDFHLTRHLLALCESAGIACARDVFKHYRCDAASAIEAGNDLRTALICFGADASHGYERVHIDSLRAVAELVTLYLQSPPAVPRDRRELAPLEGFPHQPSPSPPGTPVVPPDLP